MSYGYGYGRGFGFRGYSPPGPYVGRGRGGLPRCWYPGAWAVQPGWAPPPPTTPPMPPYGPAPTREEELDFLKSEAETMKRHLEEIDTRIQELESE